jgi:hypothetical protein
MRVSEPVPSAPDPDHASSAPRMALSGFGSLVKECSGFHGFEIRATEDLCEYIPHYESSSGSYIHYEGGFEGCKTG